MERNEESHTGIYGWVCLGAFVAGWDALAPETLSSAFRRGLENPRTRYLVLGAWAITSAHLLGLLPDNIDPFRSLEHLQDRPDKV